MIRGSTGTRTRSNAGAPILGLVLAGLLTACASAGPAGTDPAGPAPTVAGGPTTDAERAEAAALLASARDRYDAGDFAGALSEADDVVARFPSTPASAPALLLAARAALELEDFEGAETRARRYAGLFPGDEVGARPALEILEESRDRRARAGADREARGLLLGVIVPQSGSRVLETYGELVIEGARLAVETFRGATEREVRLEIRDDGADRGRGAILAGELEEAGADAILGPLLSESLLSAADVRRDLALPIISPTASDHPDGRPSAFTLNAPNPLDAERLAEYALERGYGRIALLYPRTAAFEFLADAFRTRLAEGGRQPTLDIGYGEGKTTFRDEINQMARAGIEAVFAPADVRGIRQLAPQIAFLGGTPIAVLGNDAWASEETLRLVEPQALEGVVVATSDARTLGTPEHEAFVTRYESTYRRTLDNSFPALGYDAATLLLAQAAARQNGDVAQGLAPDTWYRGATGQIGVRDGIVVRRSRLVRIESGRPLGIGGGE